MRFVYWLVCIKYWGFCCNVYEIFWGWIRGYFGLCRVIGSWVMRCFYFFLGILMYLWKIEFGFGGYRYYSSDRMEWERLGYWDFIMGVFGYYLGIIISVLVDLVFLSFFYEWLSLFFVILVFWNFNVFDFWDKVFVFLNIVEEKGFVVLNYC